MKPKIFGSSPSHYTVAVSFDDFRTVVAIYHFNQHVNLVKFMFDFKRARRVVAENPLNSSSITGANYPMYSQRWYACHNVWFQIIDNTTPIPRVYSIQKYKAPYLVQIEATVTGDTVNDINDTDN